MSDKPVRGLFLPKHQLNKSSLEQKIVLGLVWHQLHSHLEKIPKELVVDLVVVLNLG